MTISVVQAVQANGTSTSSVSATLSSTGSGHAVVVAVAWGGSTASGTVSSVTMGSDTFTLITSNEYSFGTTAFYLDQNCSSGNTSLTVHLSGGSGTFQASITVFEISGLPTSGNILDQVGHGGAFDSIENYVGSSWVQTQNANDILLGIAVLNETIGSQPAGWTTQPFTGGAEFNYSTGYIIESSTGTFQYGITVSNNTFPSDAVTTIALSNTVLSAVQPQIVQFNGFTFTGTLTANGTMFYDFTAGNLLVFAAQAWAFSGTEPTLVAPTLAVSGDTFTSAVASTVTAGFPTAAIYYLPNCPSGEVTINFSVTGSTAADTIILWNVWELSGMPASGVLDQTAQNSSSSASPSVTSGTTTGINEFVVGQLATGGTDTTYTAASSPWMIAASFEDITSSTHSNYQITGAQIGFSETTYTYSASLAAAKDMVVQIATFFSNQPAAGSAQPLLIGMFPV